MYLSISNCEAITDGKTSAQKGSPNQESKIAY